MKLYVIVEGERTEPLLCRAWLPLIYSGITEVVRPEDLVENSFYLVAGQGYPSYFGRISDAADDLSDAEVQLVIWADAEEETLEARYAELEEACKSAGIANAHTLLIADCCVETWLLGNRPFLRKGLTRPALQPFIEHYNVVGLDPEGCPQRATDANRAATHLKYLKAAFRCCVDVGHPDDARRLRYNKNNPGPVVTPAYLSALHKRIAGGHLQSMRPLFTLNG